MTKDTIKDGLFAADRYSDPVQVLNTDYKNYLITYQCRQQLRLGSEDKDYLSMDPETYREIVENYNAAKHEKLMAQLFMKTNSEVSLYKTLARQIKNQTRELTHGDYQKELETISAIDSTHRIVFSFHKPTFKEWKERRKLYIDSKLKQSDLSVKFDKTKKQHFNSLDIKIYIRDPKKYVNYDKILDLIDIARASVPGYDFDNQNSLIQHNSTCIEGDIFDHHNIKKVKDVASIQRKNVKTTREWEQEEQEDVNKDRKAQNLGQGKKKEEDDAEQQGFFDDEEEYGDNNDDEDSKKDDSKEDEFENKGFFDDDDNIGDYEEENHGAVKSEDIGEQQGFFDDEDEVGDDDEDSDHQVENAEEQDIEDDDEHIIHEDEGQEEDENAHRDKDEEEEDHPDEVEHHEEHPNEVEHHEEHQASKPANSAVKEDL